ncbi:MAG TPA: 16S rRNA (adenine(1518)-N(6)/adenine(1519)-N(6))-dimethyltransferase RsmA [Burkholderiales bacterium]|nr:16S rRNA (adenine(1518)-N(6)/adenine(1519)-N(6))-dimethyltransferase RsmA [Burkholderiales bacterium]
MHVPRKRFGQNFLEERAVVARMLAAIAPQPHERFVEIGPGLGALTDPLLERLGHLHVVEIDRDIVARLRGRHGAGKLDVHEGDALAFDFSALGPDLRVVGNLPYNISTPLLFHLGAHARAVRDAHFMLQREVVERMGARPGTPQYGRLSVMLQYRWEVEPLFDVGPEAFRPAPKVWSSVVRMVPHRVLPHAADDETMLAAIVGKAFGQRRKTLRNAMREVLSGADFDALGIDPASRGETLDVAQFVRIANFAARRIPSPGLPS